MPRFRRLVREVHRRSLWQVIGIYLAGGWIALEAAGSLTESFGLPEWFPAFALGLLVIGFPVVVATAFIQEGGPGGEGGQASDGQTVPGGKTVPGEETATEHEKASAGAPGNPEHDAAAGPGARQGGGMADGLARSSSVSRAGSSRFFTWKNTAFAGLGAFGIWGVFATLWILPLRGPSPSDGDAPDLRSVAVLPFENIAADGDAYFTDGIHEEIISQLAGIGALRVISRTSVMEYRDRPTPLPQIARELGVAAILEGSVRRAGNRVRITAQLIDAASDVHLWSESYERELEDVFAIQADVARRIAEALRAELDPAESALLDRRPTEDVEAYDLYLRALEFNRAGRSPENVSSAITLLERAVERDPSFLAAVSRLNHQHLLMHWYGYDRSGERIERARDLVRQAERIDPSAPETRLARGYLLYYGEVDFEAALAEFEEAEQGPDRHEAALASAWIHRRMGHFDRHLEKLRSAQRLNPRDATILVNLGQSLTWVRSYADAERALRLALDRTPADGGVYARLADTRRLRGELEEARRILRSAPENVTNPDAIVAATVALSRADGRYGEALERLDAYSHAWLETTTTRLPTDLARARLLELAGDTTAARNAYARAHRAIVARLEDDPGDSRLWEGRAEVAAALGSREEALEAMDAVRRHYPVERDHLSGPEYLLAIARTEVRLGRSEEALAILEDLMSRPAPISAASLRQDPDWDPLRDEPRFRALLGASPSGSTPVGSSEGVGP